MAASLAHAAIPTETNAACPTCGCELQATAQVWLSVLPDGTVVPAFGEGDNVGEEMKWYCASNHDTSGVAISQGLEEKVRDYLEERIR